MSFFETPLRRLRIIRGCGLLVVALAIGALSITPDVDAGGRIFCYAIAGFFALMGLFNLWRARRTPSTASVTMFPDRAPISEQVPVYRRMLWLSIIVFPVITAWVAYDLHRLESGRVERIEVWAPLIPIYAHFGYWPTVLSPAVLGVICCVVFNYKLRKLSISGSSDCKTRLTRT